MSDTDAFGYETNVKPASMRTFAEALRRIAAQHDAIAESMEKGGISSVRAKNLTMAANALIALGKFAGAVTTACCDEESAAGVAELEGGIAQLRRYLKRTSETVNPPSPKDKANTAAAAAKRGASRGARDKKP